MLIAAAVLFAAFAANVATGAFSGAAPVGDVGEMLLLLASAVALSVAALKREAAERGAGPETDGAPDQAS